MAGTNMKAVTKTDVVRVTQELWGPMLNLEVRHVEAPPPDFPDGLIACVQIAGRWEGGVHLQLSASLAQQVAAAFLGMEPTETTWAQLRDCAGELANIIAGGIKRLVPAPSRISLPSVAETRVAELDLPDSHTSMHTVFDHCGERFVVTVIEANNGAVMGES
jgi:chemotaxis protein CheX